MKNIATLIAVLGLATSIVVAADKPNVPVAGAILQLNKPGTILIEISIGSDDGLKTGDVFVVSRKDKRIGKLTITKCEPDRSTAKIVVVNDGETLQIGDQVANRSASLNAARPPRKMQNKHQPSDGQSAK